MSNSTLFVALAVLLVMTYWSSGNDSIAGGPGTESANGGAGSSDNVYCRD